MKALIIDAAANARRRLTLTLLLALSVHIVAVILLRPEPTPAPAPEPLFSLNIALRAQTRSDTATPQRSQPSAVTDDQSFDPAPAALASAPLLAPTDATPDSVDPPLPQPRPTPPSKSPSPAAAATAPKPRATPEPAPAVSVPPSTPAPADTSTLMQRSLQMARQTVTAASAANPREHRLNPKSMTTLEKFYLQAWVRKVEQVGTLNFPEAALQLAVNTGPTLDVALRADGSIKDIYIVRSSGHSVLDRAALRIVRLAAPYAPFPVALKRQYDVLHIVRQWKFEHGRLSGR